MEKAVTATSRLLAIVSALSLVVLMLAIASDVAMRFISKASLPGMLELAESSLVVAVFFGLAWAGIKGEHVAVTLLTDRLGARANAVIGVAVWSVSSVFLTWMLYATFENALDATANLEERFGLVRWPIYPFRWVIAFGIAVFLLVSILNLVRAIRGRHALGDAHSADSDAQPHLASQAREA